jgi:hypothetical protein
MHRSSCEVEGRALASSEETDPGRTDEPQENRMQRGSCCKSPAKKRLAVACRG